MRLPLIQVTKAATALLKHASKKSAAEAGDKNELFADEQFVWLLVGLKKVPDLKKKAVKMYGAVLTGDATSLLNNDANRPYGIVQRYSHSCIHERR